MENPSESFRRLVGNSPPRSLRRVHHRARRGCRASNLLNSRARHDFVEHTLDRPTTTGHDDDSRASQRQGRVARRPSTTCLRRYICLEIRRFVDTNANCVPNTIVSSRLRVRLFAQHEGGTPTSFPTLTHGHSAESEVTRGALSNENSISRSTSVSPSSSSLSLVVGCTSVFGSKQQSLARSESLKRNTSAEIAERNAPEESQTVTS